MCRFYLNYGTTYNFYFMTLQAYEWTEEKKADFREEG